ncbi:hypothetical protein WH47_08644, partial [Habropoda laboriosa]
DRKSSFKQIKASIPRNSIFGPELFNTYLNDISTFPKTKIQRYTDDTIIHGYSFNGISY